MFSASHPCVVVLLGAADHGAEAGEQEVDCVWVTLLLLQPDRVCPLGTQPVQSLSAEVVLVLVGVGARQDSLAAVRRPAQQVGDVSVAPELGDIVCGLRRAVH